MTSCKKCLFRVDGHNAQVGCQADRLSKNVDKKMVYEDGVYHFETDLMCNMYRDESWKEEEKLVKSARREIECTFGIILNVNDITKDYVQRVIRTFSRFNYDRSKIKVVLCHKNKLEDRQAKIALIHELWGFLIKDGFSCGIIEGSDEYYQEVDAIRLCGNKMFICLASEDPQIEPDDFSRIDGAVNDDLKKVSIVFNGGMEVFSLGAYVNLNYLSCGNYVEVLRKLLKESRDHGTYLEL